ncbi:hypothetical protein DFH08DRAFT_1029728 [Mycena albidolilacea]|uniref:Uncharacterized protein n=1 Tax=Mycena albidolilacea TaxID=1033008 RepID=A0AAD6ZHQ2_9AGAR|nr:hypothetical protein DFH08DRAFT_1029728 [Mycena albidolilacea]
MGERQQRRHLHATEGHGEAGWDAGWGLIRAKFAHMGRRSLPDACVEADETSVADARRCGDEPTNRLNTEGRINVQVGPTVLELSNKGGRQPKSVVCVKGTGFYSRGLYLGNTKTGKVPNVNIAETPNITEYGFSGEQGSSAVLDAKILSFPQQLEASTCTYATFTSLGVLADACSVDGSPCNVLGTNSWVPDSARMNPRDVDERERCDGAATI